MAKNVVIVCDSLQSPLANNGTNAVKLYSGLALDEAGRQVGYYRPGLPEGSFFALAGWLYSGQGVREALTGCYSFLMDNFEAGDRVFLFGCGHGAYVVRALASMLHLVGLLHKGNDALIPAILQVLKRPAAEVLGAAGRFRAAFPQPCSPYFVGVWDTPAKWGYFSDPIRPPYMARNPGITIGRHAISIDERRSMFRPSLWAKAEPGQDLKEVWFAGVHSDVTGGYPEAESGLSKVSLEWMLKEAESAGLLLDTRKVRAELGYDGGGRTQPDPSGPIHNSLQGLSWWLLEFMPTPTIVAAGEDFRYQFRIPMGKRRDVAPGSVIHESVAQRGASVADYRPPNLPEQFSTEPMVKWEASMTRMDTQAQTIVRPPQTLPPQLVNDLRAGQCVLYAGAGVSATAGLPVWKEFATQLLNAAGRENVTSDEFEQFRAAAEAGKTDYVVDGIVAKLAPDVLQTFLRLTFQRMREVPPVYRGLSSLPFASALTTNFDNLLERAWGTPPDQVRTPQDVDALLGAMKENKFFVLHLYGTLDRPETTLVSPAQFDDAISANLPFRELMENLFVTRTILFAGCSLEGIETYLRGLRFKRKSSRTHYAIAGVSGSGWQVMAGVLRDRYGIEVIPYEDGSSGGLEDLVTALRKEIEVKGPPANPTVASAPAAETTRSFLLTRLVLDNIGPFQHLPLDLNPDVNVFLGDNGVGKSTILRAIAAVLCGRLAERSAVQMLRARQGPGSSGTSGSIEIAFGRNTYNTTIITRTSGAEVASPPVIPVAAEQVLALGFPPLRTMAASGNTVMPPAASEPVAEDLLPLVLGEPDFRLAGLRNWIIRLDHQAKDEETRGVPTRSKDLMNKLFEATSKLAEGLKIELAGVNARTQQIIVRTDDGEVPLELISQGTASIISCVGVILQRLYEVYPRDENPSQRQFLVLMDEIDAHMHPQWQRILLNRIREIFPNVQLIATTHSPLIIADLPWDRVFHVARPRDEEGHAAGPVEVRQYEMRLDKLGSSQILLSPLFGLDYAQGENMERAQKEYADLRLVETPNKTQQARLDDLARLLFGRDARTTELVTDRAYSAIEQGIEKTIEDQPVEEQEKMLEKARAALRERMGRPN